jgi:SOS response regulatory protein OraA/RecX
MRKVCICTLNAEMAQGSANYLKQKLLSELLDLGYDRCDIINMIDSNLNSDEYIILKKEFEKTYTRLEKKYNGYDLYKNVKNKMLSRGFNINEIELLLKEKTEK